MSDSTTCETMKEAGDQLGEKACEVMRTVEQSTGDWTHEAQDNLDSLARVASGYVAQGQQKAQELGRTVSGEVRERPVAALLAAAGLGFLLGVFLKRR